MIFRRPVSLYEKLILYFFLLSIVIIVSVGAYSYYSSREALKFRTFEQLIAVKHEKQKNIERFFNERIHEIRFLAASKEIITLVEILDGLPSGQRLTESAQIKKYTDVIKQYPGISHDYAGYYPGIWIIDKNYKGFKIALSDSIETAQDLFPAGQLKDLWNTVCGQDTTLVKEIPTLKNDNNFSLILGTPVKNISGKIIGMLTLKISPEFVNSIIFEGYPDKGFGKTGESYLVGQDFLMRSNSRFQEKALNKTPVKTVAVEDAFRGPEGSVLNRDYRGIQVFASHCQVNIPGLKWVLIAEIDESEVLQKMTGFKNRLILISIIILLASLALSAILSQQITKPLRLMKLAADNVRRGNFDFLFEPRKNDEIGSFMDAFNRMTRRLKKQTEELKEREQRLSHFYEATTDGIILHEDGKAVLVNRALSVMTEFSHEELMQKMMGEIIDVSEKTESPFQNIPVSFETTLFRNSKSRLPVEVEESTLEYEGRLIKATLIRDISKRREMERKLRIERIRRTRSLIDGQEMERQRLSRELHDGLGQSLIALKLKLESLIHADMEQTRKTIAELKNLFNLTIDEVRNITNDLMPPVLNEFGLVHATRSLCDEISDRYSTQVVFKTQGIPDDLSELVKTYFFRIAQEALTNAVKHSEASIVRVYLTQNEKIISLIVEDNGKGFNFEEVYRTRGNGLFNMRERTNLLLGKFNVSSGPTGTMLTINVPINLFTDG